MADAPSRTSNILLSASRLLLALVLVFIVGVALFGYGLPLAWNHRIHYAAAETQSDSTAASTAVPVVVQVVAPAAPDAPLVAADEGAASAAQADPEGGDLVTQYLGTRFGDMRPVGQGCTPGQRDAQDDGHWSRCRTNLRIQERRLPDGRTVRRACETDANGQVLEDTCRPEPQA